MIIIPLMLLVSCWLTSKLLAGEEIQDILIETYFSEDYSKYIDSFEGGDARAKVCPRTHLEGQES